MFFNFYYSNVSFITNTYLVFVNTKTKIINIENLIIMNNKLFVLKSQTLKSYRTLGIMYEQNLKLKEF